MQKLSIVIKLYRTLPFLEHLPINVLLILASKTELKRFAKDTLICMQGDMSSHIYFVKSGRVKIIRTIDFLEIDEITKFNYNDLYKDPTEDEIKMG